MNNITYYSIYKDIFSSVLARIEIYTELYFLYLSRKFPHRKTQDIHKQIRNIHDLYGLAPHAQEKFSPERSLDEDSQAIIRIFDEFIFGKLELSLPEGLINDTIKEEFVTSFISIDLCLMLNNIAFMLYTCLLPVKEKLYIKVIKTLCTNLLVQSLLDVFFGFFFNHLNFSISLIFKGLAPSKINTCILFFIHLFLCLQVRFKVQQIHDFRNRIHEAYEKRNCKKVLH